MTLAPGLLLLADSRLPTGGHAHSGGVEEAVRHGDVTGPPDLAAFLAARVPTTGLVAAACAAAACALAGEERGSPSPRGAQPGRPSLPAGAPGWARWEDALDARTPVAALREVSRAQGRALVRTVRRVWPEASLDGLGARPHQALVLGVATAAAGAGPDDAAALAVHHLVGQATTAAVRLLGLDPLALAGVHARALEAAVPTVARAAAAGAAAASADDPDLLPAATTPRPEVLAVLHARAEGALFAS
ncbi:urease accessory protein UreF [Actinomycetospora sp. NBRC 106375]|uniref:urease accessory protein UreF n=1 Tax=Actinomycetospora sp. NBRC 106375 TaxID=3032207 RepID=UPI00249FA374|nr:urease accessory UreF family protein [Actinomycetospora sp. NBRC 106375]GLZ44414.1 urease accessory protein UreF [Actinomycetospora sp. NBRC 106375]